jgi:hypothetical protein
MEFRKAHNIPQTSDKKYTYKISQVTVNRYIIRSHLSILFIGFKTKTKIYHLDEYKTKKYDVQFRYVGWMVLVPIIL